METETIGGKTVSKTFNAFEDFEIGEVVRLKSGGPEMTVDGGGGSRIICVWFDATGEFHRQDFDQGALEKVTPASDEAVSEP